MKDLFVFITTEVEDEKSAEKKILALQEMVKRHGMKVEMAMLSPDKIPVHWERRN